MNMIKNLSALALLVFCLNVVAQTTPPASIQAVTAEQKAAMAEMLEAMNFKQMMSQMAAAMSQSMPQMAEQMAAPSLAKLSPEAQAKARAQSLESMKSSMPKMMAIYTDPTVLSGLEDIMGRAYLKRFSLDEIKAITMFYKSDAGKKMLTTTPQLMQETMPEMMGLIMPRISEIAQDIAKETMAKFGTEAEVNKPKSAKTAPAEKKAEAAKK